MRKLFLLFFLLLTAAASGERPQYLVINNHFQCNGRGFFSILDYVFVCFHWIEEHPGYYIGFEVDFEKDGMYYDPHYGPNSWNYYFKPLKRGVRPHKNIIHVRKEFPGQSPFLHMKLDKFLIHERICRYLELRDDLAKEIQDFADLHFTGKHVIGIHYRGTDKIVEAEILTYEQLLNEIEEEIARAPENWHLYVATDEQAFLDFIVEKFPGRVSYLEDCERSTHGLAIHTHPSSPYLSGKWAVMDCILLSRTQFLLRTCSNLSRWSTYFNPWLENRELTKMRRRASR